MSEIAVIGEKLPAEIQPLADAELELRRRMAILDVMKRGRASLREQASALRDCVEAAYLGVDLVDEMREAGQLAEHGGDRATSEVRTLNDVGLTRQRVSEWRSLRDHDALAFLDKALQTDRVSTFEKVSLNWLRKRVERISRERHAAAADPDPVYDHELRHGDFRTTLDDLAGKVDAIITDPPYPAEFLDEYEALGEVTARLLAPGGLLVVMVGQAHLPDYLERLGRHLEYRWCGAYLMPGAAARVHSRHVSTKWKPLLIYGGDRFLIQDVFVDGSAAPDKRYHEWGQTESGMAEIVARTTRPGELVVDPFLGAGTTAVVCRELGRSFVGCDIDPDAVAIARRRLNG